MRERSQAPYGTFTPNDIVAFPHHPPATRAPACAGEELSFELRQTLEQFMEERLREMQRAGLLAEEDEEESSPLTPE